MDRFLVMESQLIEVQVEENTNFHCIVCKAEFLTRSERNEHLETHFIHCNCKHCSRPVIVIGDLEFELHYPTYCKQVDIKHEEIFGPGDESIDEDILPTNRLEVQEDCLETEESNMTSESKYNDNYVEEIKQVEHKPIVKIKKEKPVRKSKRKITKKTIKPEHIDVENKCEPNSDDEFVDSTYLARKADSDSEDDVVKEMDVVLKKRRKQYTKLPKTVPCTFTKCEAMFGTERTLKIHMHQIHGIKERYICPICSREFKIGGNLKQHIETHSDYKRFICNYCGKGFHLPYNLKEHMNTHTGARPYKCETCGKTFGRNTLRQAHMRIHTGEKPYKCTEENCDRAYAYQTDLKRHRRSVHGIITKTFPCPICSKVFYENKFLTKHLNVHQGDA